jgi:hypothetical protein
MLLRRDEANKAPLLRYVSFDTGGVRLIGSMFKKL